MNEKYHNVLNLKLKKKKNGVISHCTTVAPLKPFFLPFFKRTNMIGIASECKNIRA